MTTQLSTHFSLEELTITQVRGVDNTPNTEIVSNLNHTAWQMEIVRHILGDIPIHVNSGYRSAAVNAAVGGSEHSAHCLGYAVDFICPEFGEPLQVAKKILASGLKFDQLITEGTWVHISFDPRLRGQAMTAHFVPGKPTSYTDGLS
jgi:putative chitinase